MSTSLTGNLSAIRTQRILYSFHPHIRLRIPPITAKIRRRKLTNWSASPSMAPCISINSTLQQACFLYIYHQLPCSKFSLMLRGGVTGNACIEVLQMTIKYLNKCPTVATWSGFRSSYCRVVWRSSDLDKWGLRVDGRSSGLHLTPLLCPFF